ncbi:hypothetical protein Hrd1104_00130 [Halorhabdus sp. CBA1104]|uniref:hypothetical protein n=1 Tax=Halorhabdus sp. CBA1104 TaxID=1380432 RepID=UPI0012B1E6AB|nr:hypothetical protein [Halorhabdus sp. CBA1104]QGN05852.1 hypothetical protein Hrd1104_00130 [Halorhabdus sp. CBA1104]
MPVLYEEAFGEIDLELTEYEFDNSGLGEFDSPRRPSLKQYTDSGWTEITLSGEITLPASTLELFPNDERADPPGELLLAIDCLDTHYRFGTTIEDSDIEATTYTFEETLSRDYAYGDVELRPILVRTEPCDEEKYAQYPYMRIADGPEAIVSFDDVETEGSNLMDVRFESFEKREVVPDHNLYYLDRTDVSSPRVWVNEDYELITRVLDHDAHTGWAADMQSGLAPWIANNVVSELVLWAILCAEDGEFDADWQEPLLEKYGPDIYEAMDAEEPEELHEQLAEGGDEAHYLVNVVNKVVQDQVRVTPPLEEFIENQATDYFLEGS